MNQHVPPSTMARHQFTLDDVLDLIARGMVGQRVQLLGGEIYDMPADGAQHARFAMGIGQQFMAKLFGKPYFVGIQTTLKLSDHNAPSPDVFILSGNLPDSDVPPSHILLVVEVGDTTLSSDLAHKARIYAEHGVREYWVVDVKARVIHVHRDPQAGGYPQPQVIDAATSIAARLIPDIAIRLADIG